MPESRECAVCGKEIRWFERGLGIIALDKNPTLEGQYVIVEGKAHLLDAINEPTQKLLEGPKYQNHVLTCVAPKVRGGGREGAR